MKDISHLKTICRLFNASSSLYEFKIYLDLHCISIVKACELYCRNCKNIIKYMKHFWCDKNGVFSWNCVFKYVKYYYLKDSTKHIVLPYKFEILHVGMLTNYTMHTVFPDGTERVLNTSSAIDAEINMFYKYKIDMHAEMFSTMMYEMAMEMDNMR